jgi:hypothetical protein
LEELENKGSIKFAGAMHDLANGTVKFTGYSDPAVDTVTVLRFPSRTTKGTASNHRPARTECEWPGLARFSTQPEITANVHQPVRILRTDSTRVTEPNIVSFSCGAN